MKERLDLVRSWIRKAESDLASLNLALGAGTALDAACFHAQQAAEKYLKAYLIFADVNFPFTHNLAKLLDLCASHDPTFAGLAALVDPLTPYAVELRYDEDFWPSLDTARQAQEAAQTVRGLVLARLPAEAAGLDP